MDHRCLGSQATGAEHDLSAGGQLNQRQGCAGANIQEESNMGNSYADDAICCSRSQKICSSRTEVRRPWTLTFRITFAPPIASSREVGDGSKSVVRFCSFGTGHPRPGHADGSTQNSLICGRCSQKEPHQPGRADGVVSTKASPVTD